MDRINLLFLAPHLSTGGMPSFLLKRIQALKTFYKNVEIFVVEYSDFSPTYVVQKNQIRKIISPDRYWTLGDNKYELIDIIKNNNISVVHIEEMIEGFESFNQVPDDLKKMIYDENRTWRVVETCHNIWFDPSLHKRFHPDAYAFCTPYHKKHTFKKMPSYGEIIEFPIENKYVSKLTKKISQQELGLDTGKIHILNVGLWTRGKNQGELVSIAKKLELSHPNFHFHFVGNLSINFEDYWKPIVSDLPKNVTIWAERNDVNKFMSACDIFFFNSTWECNPLSIREAISYNMKIMTRNLPQYLDMFTKYIVEINDDIEQSIDKLISLTKSHPTYKRPCEEFEKFARKHYELYSKIIKEPNLTNTDSSDTIPVKIIQNYVGEPFMEILSDIDKEFEIYFIDENNIIEYYNKIKSNHWIKLNRKYFTKWTARVVCDDEIIYEDTLDYKGKRVYIAIDSSSLGDNLAWIPFCREFKKIHNCELIVSTFWNSLFRKSYPEIEFVEPGQVVNNLYGMYTVGCFYDANKEPEPFNTLPLQKTITNILGLEHKEIKPEIDFTPKFNPYLKKYVTIAPNSTAGCKEWTKEGWQNLIDYLNEKGFLVVNISRERNEFKNVIKIDNKPIEHIMNIIHFSEFFIGLSSGLSWLAWSLGKHVVLISNFTNSEHEFSSNCTRINNTSVCHGCWHSTDYKFDKGDWNWCPLHKGTERHFECHTSITSDMIIDKIQHLIK